MATSPFHFSGNESKLVSLELNQRAVPACPNAGKVPVVAGNEFIPCSPYYAGWLAPGVGSSSNSMKAAEKVSECKTHEI